MIRYESWEEVHGEVWCECTCTCDKCGKEKEPEELYEVGRFMYRNEHGYVDEGIYCRDCLLKMFPHVTDEEGYEMLDLGDGTLCPVDELDAELCPVDPCDVEKWEARYGYEPDWDLIAKDKLLWG